MSKTIKQLVQKFNELWTQHDVDYAFGVSTMTIWNWRQRRGFPASVQFRGKTARFIPDEVRTWAKQNGYRIREPRREPTSKVAA